MAATGTPTPNIGLRCPVGTDPASVDDINYNSGVIDTKLGAVGSTSVQAQIDALNSNLTRTNIYSNSGNTLKVEKSGNVYCLYTSNYVSKADFDALQTDLPSSAKPVYTIGTVATAKVGSTYKSYYATFTTTGSLYLGQENGNSLTNWDSVMIALTWIK